MADALLMIRHASVDDDSEQSSEQPIGKNRKPSLISVHGPKSPELLEEIREQKFQKQRLTGRLTHIDPVASLQGRFSFLRRGKKPMANSSPQMSSTTTTMEMPTMYPRRQTGKDFEFDMEQEIEHEKERLAKLPPGGENIWA